MSSYRRSSRRRGGRSGGRGGAAGRGRPRREPDYYEDDEYDDEYDDAPRSNALPWIIVSMVVVAALVVIIWFALPDGGSKPDADRDPNLTPSAARLGRLAYGSFSNVAYKVKYQENRTIDTEETYQGHSVRVWGVLTISLSGGSGTATLEVNHYKSRGRDLEITECPAHGRSISFSVDPQGSFRTADNSLEAFPVRALAAALFPDLPHEVVDPTRGDTWTMHSADPLVGMLPTPGPITADVSRFESRLRASEVGEWPRGDPISLSCVKFFHKDPAKVGGRARVTVAGEPLPAKFYNEGSGTFIMDYEHGVPCNADAVWDGNFTLNPGTKAYSKCKFKVTAFANRIATTD